MTDSPSVPPPEPAPVSPRWAPATKFLVSLVIVTLVGALLIRFRSLLSPLALALILAYLLNPVVEWLARRTRLAWGAAVLVVFAVIALLLLGVIVAAGIAIAQQVD